MSNMVTLSLDKLSLLHLHIPSARGPIFTRMLITPMSWHTVGVQYASQGYLLHEKRYGFNFFFFLFKKSSSRKEPFSPFHILNS